MAISTSKKSLGKILAISLASAMAMSSLSAALVSVSAVQDPALASNGSVDFASIEGKTSAEDVIKREFQISDIDDDVVDAVGNGEKDLQTLTDALKASSCAGFTYTDSDGLEIPVEGLDVEYKVTSGTSYLKYDKNTKKLTAQDKSGSATLQIKVTGEADIGGGRDKKKVTFTQNIKIDVHQQGEIGLKATIDDGLSYLNDADLNDLAAYGSIVKYQLVKYKISPASDLQAVIEDVAVGAVGGSAVEGADAPEQKTNIQAEVTDYLATAVADGDIPSLTDAQRDAFLTALAEKITAVDSTNNPDGPQQITKTDWNTLRLTELLPAVEEGHEELYADDDPKVTSAVTNYITSKNNAAANTVFQVEDTTTRAATPVPAGIYVKDDDATNVAAITVQPDKEGADPVEVYKVADGADPVFLVLDAQKKPTVLAAEEAKEFSQLTVKEADLTTKLEGGATLPTNVIESDGNYYTTDGSAPTNFQNASGDEIFTLEATPSKVTFVNTGTVADATWEAIGNREVVKTFELTWQEVANPDSVRDAVLVGDVFKYSGTGYENGTGTIDLKPIVENAYKEPATEGGAGGDEGVAATALIPESTESITQIRFYAGSGQDLFDVVNDYTEKTGGGSDWERSTKTNEDKGVTDASGAVYLRTNGSTGTGSIKVAVSHRPTADVGDPTKKDKVDELTLNVKVVKAADFGTESVTLDRSGSKTYVSACSGTDVTEEKNINGFEIRTTGIVTVENGTVGTVKDANSVIVNGGRVGNIDIADAGTVEVTEDGTVGDIINAASVDVNEGGQAGNITADADVSLSEGTIASIDVDGDVTISGGTVTGNVTATGDITISSDDTDGNDDALDTTIGGNVTLLAGGKEAAISINNVSDDGAASLSINGNVVAKHVDTGSNADTATISIGDADTTGLIKIGGAVEGEVVQLGGNGLVSLAGVRAASEVERTDDDGEIIESTLIFDGFNSAIASINNFANVNVNEGTVVVNGAVNATNLTVNSDAQIVAQSISVEEDIIESGSIVVPVGQLTVTGSVDDSPTLALTGELTEGALAFVGNRGLVDAFDMGGVTLRAERQSNGNYNYLIDKVELNGLTAIGKDVATGVKQEKNVSVALDGTLPEGASIVWESDDADIATVVGNGASAVITGEDVGTTTVTAKIVDANGRELGYEDASFDVNVLDNATVDSIGGDIGPDDNELDLDTKKKNMTAGDTYTFMVRGNNDVDNLSVTSGDTNVATVALANGADARGALYNITAVADGKTDITVTYQGKTSKIAVKVGGFQLDTTSKKMAPGQVYSVLAKNVPADQAGNVTLAYDSNIVDVVKVNDNYNGRGVLFNVTAKAIGDTEVKVTYNNETESMAVNVVENTGKLTLDTASYTMPFGGTYTIGVKVEKNGRELSGEEVRAMITSGELVVTDSRTGSIVTTEVQANGNVRVTGRQREGTTYVQFIVMQNGQRVTHASVGVTVQNGATAGGSSVRSISQW